MCRVWQMSLCSDRSGALQDGKWFLNGLWRPHEAIIWNDGFILLAHLPARTHLYAIGFLHESDHQSAHIFELT